MMKNRFVVIALLMVTINVGGCSSLPSMPWSGSRLPPDPTADALFEEGVRNFNDKRYVRAIDNFSKIRAEHPFSPLLTEVELKIADAYYRNEQYPEAVNGFKEFQAMHPTSEHIPFVLLRLGQAHFNQFTSVERDQKNTEIAKGYFENLITQYPKSPHAVEAREKLAKCLEYLAEHEFNIAQFYFRQEKYPAARDRFEEIVRKYRDTPTAVKSLFYLGESYRSEKNAVKATLAYEALIEHYPKSKFAAEARSQLAQVEKEKHDPLAMLLMRDRRPTVAAAPEVKPDPALAKLRDLNLVTKTEVVHENPGDEKGFLRRVADTLNPFSSSDDGKEETAVELLAKRNNKKEERSGGLLSALWPFGSKNNQAGEAKPGSNNGALVASIDESLKKEGIDSSSRQAALNPPPADLPKTDDPEGGPAVKTDTAAVVRSIDSELGKSGKDGTTVPTPPEIADAFKNPPEPQVAEPAQTEPVQGIQSSGILASIDQKLEAKGVNPDQFQQPVPAATDSDRRPTRKQETKNVAIEPRMALEKGPLYLNPGEVSAKPAAAGSQEEAKPAEPSARSKEPSSRVLVKGPVESTTKTGPAENKQPSSLTEEEPKGAFDQIRQDLESVGKALNPFSW